MYYAIAELIRRQRAVQRLGWGALKPPVQAQMLSVADVSKNGEFDSGSQPHAIGMGLNL